YENVDKMILKRVDVLPHGLINNIPDKLGHQGEKLKNYIQWMKDRFIELVPSEEYQPQLHIDVYGTIGILFDYDLEKISCYLAELQSIANPLSLYIEGPVDMGEKNEQIKYLAKIKGKCKQLGSTVKIVADEWCNTFEDIKDFCDAQACHMVQIKTPDLGGIQNIVESVLYCKRHQIEAYQGGTCNETEVSARTCVHVAMAARSERILAKPGMGFDEGYTITNNEMQRILAVLKYKKLHIL
ncbi:MAG: methylaspartate ammonia-lyase, partial [Spirochaetes bacterium]|nr:methylaspartate ammonia-lyase [Spirochaetota bacterium]